MRHLPTIAAIVTALWGWLLVASAGSPGSIARDQRCWAPAETAAWTQPTLWMDLDDVTPAAEETESDVDVEGPPPGSAAQATRTPLWNAKGGPVITHVAAGWVPPRCRLSSWRARATGARGPPPASRA